MGGRGSERVQCPTEAGAPTRQGSEPTFREAVSTVLLTSNLRRRLLGLAPLSLPLALAFSCARS